jgi:hypothetical protein
MNGGHKTLNNAKLVIDNLQQIKKSFLIIGSKCHCCAASIMTKKKHLSKRSKAVGGAASVGHNVDVRPVFLLVDTNNKHGGVLAGSRDDDLLSTTLQNASI